MHRHSNVSFTIELAQMVGSRCAPDSPWPTSCIDRRTSNKLQLGWILSLPWITECLRLCPFLTLLDTDGWTSNGTKRDCENFLEAFVSNQQANFLCPQLQYFRCGFALDVSVATIHKFLSLKDGTVPILMKWKGVVLTVRYGEHDQRTVYDRLKLKDIERTDLKFTVDVSFADDKNAFDRPQNPEWWWQMFGYY